MAVTFDLSKNTLHQWKKPSVDISKVYYVKDDYERIEDESDFDLCQASQQQLLQGKKSKTSQDATAAATESCVRGLECKTPMGAKRRNNNKKRTRQVVLQHQNIGDADMLAQVYSGYSNACQLQANRLAKYDEVVAKQIYHEDEITFMVENMKDLDVQNNGSTRRSSLTKKLVTIDDDDSTVSTAIESLSSLSVH